MDRPRATQTEAAESPGRRGVGRRGLIAATGATGVGVLAASAAFACTVGVHGGLVIIPKEPVVASSTAGPAQDAPGGTSGEIDLELLSTLNESSTNAPPHPGGANPYDVVIDPTNLGTDPVGNVPNFTPTQCGDQWGFGDGGGDDVVIGSISYGIPPDAEEPDTTEFDNYLHGKGSASIDPTDTTPGNDEANGGDVDAPSSTPDAGTYELCAGPHADDNWDHIRILYTS